MSTPSLSCVDVRALLRACITTGHQGGRLRQRDFLEAGKKRLSGDTARQATSGEVTSLKRETRDLKEALADTLLENRLLKKSMIADGEDIE